MPSKSQIALALQTVSTNEDGKRIPRTLQFLNSSAVLTTGA